jgi:hypothetical protein
VESEVEENKRETDRQGETRRDREREKAGESESIVDHVVPTVVTKRRAWKHTSPYATKQ